MSGLTYKRVIVGVLLAVLLTLVGAEPLANLQARPPEVRVALPPEIPAGLPFSVMLDADQVVYYHVSYAGQESSQEARSATFNFEGVIDQQDVEVHITDAQANHYKLTRQTYGLPEVIPLVQMPRNLAPGHAFSMRIHVPPALVSSDNLSVYLATDNTERLTLLELTGSLASLATPELVATSTDTTILALGRIPLGTPAGNFDITIELEDVFGRRSQHQHSLTVLADERPLETL
ncbi:MAG: hypothetical protein AAF708_13635, partial [Deinococcota bacterium]